MGWGRLGWLETSWVLVTWSLHEKRVDMQLSLEVMGMEKAAVEFQMVERFVHVGCLLLA